MESQLEFIVLGNNFDGCLLTGDNKDVVEFTKTQANISDISKDLIKIKAGSKFCFLYEKTNKKKSHNDNDLVYYWGRFPDNEIKISPEILKINHKITKLSCGDQHALFLSKTGHVFSMGIGNHGELGLGKEILSTNEPVSVDFINIKYSKVYASVRTSFLIDESGLVYCFGSNKNNELGLISDVSIFDNEDLLENICIPTVNNNLKNINKIRTGLKHSVFINNSKQIYATGNNEKGVLGVKDLFYIKKEIAFLTDITHILKFDYDTYKIDIDNIKDIRCSWNNTYILMNDDSIYSTGYGKFGQLGFNHKYENGSNNILKIFTKINIDARFNKIITGTDFIFAISDQNVIYSWGWNEHYNLGLNHNQNVFEPTLIKQDIDFNENNSKISLGGAFVIKY